MTIRYRTLTVHRHRGDPCLRLLPARRLFVASTIMRTIELGVTITDAAVDEKANDDLLQSGGPGSALPDAHTAANWVFRS